MAAAGQPLYHGADLGHASRVQAVGGLVKEQHLRVAQQGVGDAQPLLHTHGVGAELAVGSRRESHLLQQLVYLGPGSPAGDTLEVAQVVAPAEVWVEAGLLHDGANAPEEVGVDSFCRLTEEANAAGRGPRQAEQHTHGCGLAGAVGPQESEDASAGYAEGEVIHCRDGAVVLGQAAGFYYPAGIGADDVSL